MVEGESKLKRSILFLAATFAVMVCFGSRAPAAAQEASPNPGISLNPTIGGTPPQAATALDHLSETAVSAPVIVTEDGPVRGAEVGNMLAYLGIPYAAPPLGNLRWRPPQPHQRWTQVLQATTYGSACAQTNGQGGVYGSEDCLFLNVFTPLALKNQDKESPLPVMVWIHGGGLTTGSGHAYNPAPLVKHGVIVVTINYRLGYFGFFAHPAIDAEGHLNGNYGLMDQQFALKWVKRNIRAFGGDPTRVTIFGESAGGQSVYANLASPMAAGLFQRAISESGAYAEFQDYFDFIVPITQGETAGTGGVPSGKQIAASAGCGDNATPDCLRALSAQTLVNLEPPTVYPFIDGTVLTQTPGEAFASGDFNQVPVISGGNHDEWRLQVAAQYDFSGHPIKTETGYDDATTALWDGLASSVLSLYPLSNYHFPGEALGASGTDGIFACPERNSVRLLSKYVPTYAYEFNDENAPPAQSDFGGFLTFPLGAYHTSELQYLFVPVPFFGLPQGPLSTNQQELSDAMTSYWTTFAANGDPNSAGQPTWSPYKSSDDNFQSLVPPTPTVESNFASDHKCSTFWNTF